MKGSCQFLRYSCQLWMKWMWFLNKVRTFWSIQPRGHCLFKLCNIKKLLGRGLIDILHYILDCYVQRPGTYLVYIALVRQKNPYQTNKKQKGATRKIRLHILYINDLIYFVTTNVHKNKRLSISAVFPHFFNWKHRNIKEFFFIEQAKKPRFGVSPVVLGT